MTSSETVSWIFGAIALLYLAGIATYLMVRKRSDGLPQIANFILGFLSALAGGFCAYFFSGKLGLQFEVPGTQIKGDAAGGLGVFVLVLLVWFVHGRSQPKEPATLAGRALESIDRTLTRLETVWKGVSAIQNGRMPVPSVTHSRTSSGENERIEFRQVGDATPVHILTIDEVRKLLSEADMQQVVATEESMQTKIDAWDREAAKIADPAKANVDEKIRLLRIASSMSADLEAIFTAIMRTLNGQLYDHYVQERWIASRAEGLLKQLELERTMATAKAAGT